MSMRDGTLADAIDMVTLENAFLVIYNRTTEHSEDITKEYLRIFSLTCAMFVLRENDT